MAGRGRFSSLGLTTHPGSDLKLQRRSWRVNASLAITLAGDFSSCGRTSSPGYCTCRGPLSWRAVKAGEWSYLPGKLMFAGVINRILLLTLAGEFPNLLLLLTWASSNKKMWILLSRMKKWQIIAFSYWKLANRYFSYWKVTNRYFLYWKVTNLYFSLYSKINPWLILTREHLLIAGEGLWSPACH